MEIIKVRVVISSILILLFLFSFISGIGLMKAPSGRLARESDWTFLGIDRYSLERFHTITSILFSACVVVHFILNYKVFLAELKSF